MAIQLLMLDLDGTIVDTIESIREAVNRVLGDYGFPSRTYDEIRLAIGNGARELIRLSLPTEASKDADLVTRVFADYDRAYADTYSHIDGCYDGMFESLCELRARGYTLAVLSNKQDRYVKKIVEELFPEGMIAMAEGQTDLPKKPDPTVPLMMAKTLGFSPEETAFIGDSDVDMRTGKNAGMLCVGCAWGYRGEENLLSAGADMILQSAWELSRNFL